ncbi:sigma factor-like helix-turn-helix DNA-binding protein [Nonomuraea sp. NPDC050394]|uniref:sigma factor-like helix-turn-helix DNA-binding protein n=1 Tax=Nonomuraea sp. NPDC050394 TaxID=3364363 RepID=UPI00378B6115
MNGSDDEDTPLADAVRLALLDVLKTLSPAERLAFVLHGLFGLPYQEIAALLNLSPAATRRLVADARRRVDGHP